MTHFDSRPDPTGQPADGMDDLEQLLRAHRPGTPPARPEFRQALGHRFARDAAGRPSAVAGRRWRPSAWWSPPRLALATGVVGVVALVALWVAQSPRVPPAISRADLVQHNALAWSNSDTLTGRFTTGDGWYYEEWIRRLPGRLMYKRYSRPPTSTVQRPQWNVSDGRSEWVVDADSRAVRAMRPAALAVSPDAPPQERMQCAVLELPPGQTDGPAPVPALLDNVPVYRLTGTTADGQPAVFWLDARDYLVRRIDRPNGATVWARQGLDLGPDLAAEVFRPDALSNL